MFIYIVKKFVKSGTMMGRTADGGMALNNSKWIWRSVWIVSIAATLVLITGFVYAVNDVLYPKGEALAGALPQATEAPALEDGTLRIVALGDSLAKGTGDNSGKGFAKRTVDQLTSGGAKAELIGNLGINGLTTAGLQAKLNEEGIQYAVKQANVVLVSIGGNDLFRGSELLNGANAAPEEAMEEITPESLLAALPEASKRLDGILERIAGLNPKAKIYYVGLYNPFGDLEKLLTPGNQAVTAWNNAAMDLINKHPNMMLVPTFDLFSGHLDSYLYTDHFHPNGDGYERISERIVQAIR